MPSVSGGVCVSLSSCCCARAAEFLPCHYCLQSPLSRVILAPMPLPPLSTQLVATTQRVQDSCDIACMHIVPTVRSQDTSFRHPPASRPAPRASRLALVASRRAVPRGNRLRRAVPHIAPHLHAVEQSHTASRCAAPRAPPQPHEPHGATRSAVPRAPSRLHRVRSAVAAAAASPGRAGPPAVRSCVYAVPRVPPKLLPPPTQGARSRAPPRAESAAPRATPRKERSRSRCLRRSCSQPGPRRAESAARAAPRQEHQRSRLRRPTLGVAHRGAPLRLLRAAPRKECRRSVASADASRSGCAPRRTKSAATAVACCTVQERCRAWPARAGLASEWPCSSLKSAAMVVALAAAASSRMRSLFSAQPSFLCHTDNHCADFEASAPLAVPIAVERDGLSLETKEACDQAHRAASQWRAASGRVRRCRPQSVPSVAWCFPGWNRHWRYRLRPNA